MELELLMAEAQGMSEDALLEVLRFMRFIKVESRREDAFATETEKPVIRKAGKYRGKIVMSDDFDEPLEEFKEYM